MDATQGVEAQTIANAYLAIDAGLEIIPVINKIDLPNAMVDDCRLQIEDMLGLPAEDALLVSGKNGSGCAGAAGSRRCPRPAARRMKPMRP